MWADNLEKRLLDLTAQVQALECDILSPRTSTTDECVYISTPNIALTFDEWGYAKKETLDLKAPMVECDMTPESPLSPKTSTTDECVGILTMQNDTATHRNLWYYLDDINRITALIQAL